MQTCNTHLSTSRQHNSYRMVTGGFGAAAKVYCCAACRWAPACSSCQRRQRRCTGRASPASVCPLYCTGTPPSSAVSQLMYWQLAGQQRLASAATATECICMHPMLDAMLGRHQGSCMHSVCQSPCGKWFAGYWMSCWEPQGLPSMLCHDARSCCLWTCVHGIVRCSRHSAHTASLSAMQLRSTLTAV